ncbi:hypothetical protein AJ80_03894 [Polytolypa hystricis UAMH7299]|uniref:Zn(2)-C6 fungal-type domain-containing protein n=1 Tax=Polytolypa hystricis (strain UAMH7299) TaxID=1447883 RepID=A0A2B7YF74_POLH7|nr:hypothetical protein AJ80_03894 [Polytolypa hystricis UAMH7299]
MADRSMASLLTQTDFDIALNLGPGAPNQAVSSYQVNGDPYQQLPPKQQSALVDPLPARQKPKSADGLGAAGGTMTKAPANPAAPKPKRVRTGCLTCRERHLKCDETLPRCQNCQKSDRLCKRGVRLNFIDTQVAAPPYAAPFSHDWQVNFHDESREIASEYRGGFERYPAMKKQPPRKKQAMSYDFQGVMGAPTMTHQSLPAPNHLLPPFSEPPAPAIPEPIFQDDPQPAPPNSTFSEHSLPHSPFSPPKPSMLPSSNVRPCLNNAEEVLLMQVFVEEVGLWMDSMDALKHFTHILPFHSLGEPMLLNAFMACGARHLFLVNPSYGEDKALYYYNSSTRDLLSCLQNPDRDSVLCATTATVLNVYEVMCERNMQRMNHIAGARALIKECRWNAKSPGIGGACFWLNVGMELLSCLHFNWRMAWDPDTWDLDMNMSQSQGQVAGDEELWTHRMVYICAKIANFRATVPQFQGLDRGAHDMRLNQRIEEWNTYKNWCDDWTRCAPRSMQPLGYLQPWQTNSKSTFPEVWIVKRSAIVGRLFYHTACCILAKVHPTESEYSDQMMLLQQNHAHDLCGIVAHVKDRGVASVSIRCLAIASECLTSRQAQEEVLEIIGKIIKETGWQVGFLRGELMEKWGWNANQPQAQQQPQQQQQQGGSSSPPPPTSGGLSSSLLNSAMSASQPTPPPPSRPRPPAGIVNPLMATADFSFENHPYQNHYVAPHNHMQNYPYESY